MPFLRFIALFPARLFLMEGVAGRKAPNEQAVKKRALLRFHSVFPEKSPNFAARIVKKLTDRT